MTRWEYTVFKIDRGCGLQFGGTKLLNSIGTEGWELVGFDPNDPFLMIFKRPKEIVGP